MNRQQLIDKFITLRRAYREVFLTEDERLKASADKVMRDLQKFCQPYSTTLRARAANGLDPIEAAMWEGRRQVYLHLLKNLHFTEKEQVDLTKAEG